jgi:UrcA family protein
LVRRIRDETVAIRDELDARRLTRGALRRLICVSSINIPKESFMTSLASKLLLIGGFAVAAAGAAVAAPDNDVYSVVIRFPTASLTTESGVQSLYRRIEMAAEKVCVIEPAGSRLPSPAVIQCRKEAIAGAVEKIHNQRLAALHAASNKSG